MTSIFVTPGRFFSSRWCPSIVAMLLLCPWYGPFLWVVGSCPGHDVM